jgi:hypothetical protein
MAELTILVGAGLVVLGGWLATRGTSNRVPVPVRARRR